MDTYIVVYRYMRLISCGYFSFLGVKTFSWIFYFHIRYKGCLVRGNIKGVLSYGRSAWTIGLPTTVRKGWGREWSRWSLRWPTEIWAVYIFKAGTHLSYTLPIPLRSDFASRIGSERGGHICHTLFRLLSDFRLIVESLATWQSRFKQYRERFYARNV